MSDAFEDRARELAHSLPLCDFGSSQAILAMAQAFRDDDARIRALEAEVARKDAALRPFAEEADDWSIAVHNRARTRGDAMSDPISDADLANEEIVATAILRAAPNRTDCKRSLGMIARIRAAEAECAPLRGVTVAEIIDVLESAGNALCDVGPIHTTDKIDDILKRLKEPKP
jgi:hypothetical protein